MRKKLAEEAGIRKTFRGVFSRFGKKVNYKGYSEETVLIEHIVDDEKNEVMCDHIWFSLTKGFEKIKLTKGDVLQFDARIKGYQKGYKNSTLKINNTIKDFKLSHPTNISLTKKTVLKK
ncbi:MAG: hypothetical protein ORN54_13310 [Cyclobacteriaceae bacterium]|nr:hypothetical protein [Cyclobacteriaceae bacterium]